MGIFTPPRFNMMFKVINQNAFMRYLIYLISKIEYHQRTLNRKCFTKSSRATRRYLFIHPVNGGGLAFQQQCNTPDRVFLGEL